MATREGKIKIGIERTDSDGRARTEKKRLELQRGNFDWQKRVMSMRTSSSDGLSTPVDRSKLGGGTKSTGSAAHALDVVRGLTTATANGVGLIVSGVRACLGSRGQNSPQGCIWCTEVL